MNWYKKHRLEWIAECLHIFGFIRRRHLERKFGISTPQASLDFHDFIKANPGAIVYDCTLKAYKSTDDEFKVGTE